MKAKRRILSLLSLLASATGLFAANHVVQVGEKIQDAINAAADGDVIIVRDGLHVDQGAIVVAKHVRLVREKDAAVTIRGTSLSFRDLNQSTVLRDFKIENHVTIENCKQFGVEDLDLSGRNLTVTNSTLVVRTSEMNSLPCNDSSLELIGSTLAYDLNGARNVLQVVDTTFRNTTQTDSNCTIVKSTASGSGTYTRGRYVSHGATFAGQVIFDTCDWVSHGSTFNSNLLSRRSHTKLLRSHVGGTLAHEQKTAGADPDYSLDCVVFQSYVGTLTSVAKRTWVAYSTINSAIIGADTEEAHFVGNFIVESVYADSTSLDLTYLNNYSNWGVIVDPTPKLSGGSSDPNAQYDAPLDNTGWHTAKTYNFQVGTIIPALSNQIHRGANRNQARGAAFCFMKFTYANGTSANSNTATHNQNTWVNRFYNNPFPEKEVTRIQVMVRYDDHYYGRVHERLTFKVNTVLGSHEPLLTVTHAQSVRILNNSFLRVNIAGGFGGTSEIKGNVFWNPANDWPSHAISAPAPGLSQDNYFQNSGKQATGGINNDLNVVGGDPGFVDAAAGNYALKPDSRLKDKGPVEPQFNDHDGSRNDIGHFGGHMYDVNGSTSVNPVILSGEQTPFRIRLGENTPIQIKARAAVVTPDE